MTMREHRGQLSASLTHPKGSTCRRGIYAESVWDSATKQKVRNGICIDCCFDAGGDTADWAWRNDAIEACGRRLVKAAAGWRTNEQGEAGSNYLFPAQQCLEGARRREADRRDPVADTTAAGIEPGRDAAQGYRDGCGGDYTGKGRVEILSGLMLRNPG